MGKTMEIEVKDNPSEHRFETTVEGLTSFIDYKLQSGVITIIHTEVPEKLGGRGIAATMSKYALEHTAANNLKLIPLCPYMRSYLTKHPEYQYLVKDKAS